MDQEQFQKAYGKLVAKAWSDNDFKANLLADPRKVLIENDIEVPEGIEVKMLENTADTMHFIIPPEPSDELSDEELDGAVGGYDPNWGGDPSLPKPPANPNWGGDPMGG